MFSKTNLISTLVIAVWAYLGGYLLWDVIGGFLFEGHGGSATGVWKETPDYLHVVIASVFLAFAFSTIYSKLSGSAGISHGATYGLWVGILIGLGERWYDLAFSNFTDLTGAFINLGLNLVFYVIAGVLVGLVYEKLSKNVSNTH
ncbi:MAG: hypothetical protein IIB06_02020 [Bacteroidetes bacterium]|nr:hypothetical protein [Bacteroidota bacterium]